MEGFDGPTDRTIRVASEIESERLEFKADRYGHNDSTAGPPRWSRITYMAHAKGYVMARRPGSMPFVISEKLWASFQIWRNR